MGDDLSYPDFLSAKAQLKAARDSDDERHVHPLQLDVIDRVVTLWSNPGEKILTPFMGVGSEVYGAIQAQRLGIGIELKPSYYRQAVKNCDAAGRRDLSAQIAIDMESSDEATE